MTLSQSYRSITHGGLLICQFGPYANHIYWNSALLFFFLLNLPVLYLSFESNRTPTHTHAHTHTLYVVDGHRFVYRSFRFGAKRIKNRNLSSKLFCSVGFAPVRARCFRKLTKRRARTSMNRTIVRGPLQTILFYYVSVWWTERQNGVLTKVQVFSATMYLCTLHKTSLKKKHSHKRRRETSDANHWKLKFTLCEPWTTVILIRLNSQFYA